MKRWNHLLAVGLVVTMLLAACTPAPEASEKDTPVVSDSSSSGSELQTTTSEASSGSEAQDNSSEVSSGEEASSKDIQKTLEEIEAQIRQIIKENAED